MTDPTPEEIARVNAYNEARRVAEWRAVVAEREAEAAAHVQRITDALVGERVTWVKVEGMNQHGEIHYRHGYLTLTFASGRTLEVSVGGGWCERDLMVEVSDG